MFAFEDGPRAKEAYQELRRMWTACREQLGTTVPITGLRCSDQLPERLKELPAGDVLAAQERSGGQDRQCVLRRVGKVLNLSVMMLQPQPERSGRWHGNGGSLELGWREFTQLWSRVSRHNSELLLGEAVLLLARTQTKRNRWDGATPQLAASLAHLLPHDETRRRGWEHGGTTSPHGFAVWDTHQGQTIGTRELLVVAPPTMDHELSAWIWSDDGSVQLPPFAEYLLHASLLRYEAKVLDDWRAAPKPANLGDLTHELSAVFATLQHDGIAIDPGLLLAHLRRLQRGELALEQLIERLRRLAATGRDSFEHMAKAWGVDVQAIIANDAELASSLIREASVEHDTQRARLARTTRHRHFVADELARTEPAPRLRSSIPDSRAAVPSLDDKTRNVFVVYGRDGEMKEAIWSILESFGLRPFDWEILVNATGSTSTSLMEVVRLAPTMAQASVVIMTPDDVVQLHPSLAGPHDPAFETALSGQARPNVILELGMALMVTGERTILLEAGALRPIGDLAGVNVIRFDGTARTILKLASRLRLAGCPVDDTNLDLYRTGRFTRLGAFTRTPHAPGAPAH